MGNLVLRVIVLRVHSLRHRAAESLFLLPALMVLTAAGAGLAIDAFRSGIPANDLPSWLSIGTNAARTLLSTIAGATITTVGVVFSIVVVSVQLASGQFSPRIVRNFFEDRRSQLTVGILSATFTYCVLALFGASSDQLVRKGVPVMAVGVAILLGLASILSIVSFLNHSARRLYVGSLAERVMRETLRLLDRLGEPAGDDEEAEAERDEEPPADAFEVRATESGWLQQVSVDALVHVLPEGTTARLGTRVGAYVVTGTALLACWPAPPRADQAARRLRHAFVVGDERTMQQDVDFGLRQLSDIALRALSPGINDPHTAIEIVLRHGVLLRRALEVRPPSRRQRQRGVTVIRPHDLRYDDYVDHAFTDIRIVAANQPSVVRSLVATCTMLASSARELGREEAAAGPLRQVRLLLAAAERSGMLEEDLAPLQAAADGAAEPETGQGTGRQDGTGGSAGRAEARRGEARRGGRR